MMAARQTAAAQLEQFRAEMMAEAEKMRAAVERQVQRPLAYCMLLHPKPQLAELCYPCHVLVNYV